MKRRRIAVASWSACRAPFTSMYLDPRGDVKACCVNNIHRLGTVVEQPLSEIWFGERADALRSALAAGNFGLGCEACGEAVRRGAGATAQFNSFDHLTLPTSRHLWPSQLELALSNACNLQCRMCNGNLSSSIRLHRERLPPLPTVYTDAFFEDLRQFIPHLTSVVLLGGEPFLGRESVRVLDMLAAVNPNAHCHVTTNGTQMQDWVRDFVTTQRCHIAISIDGASAAVNEHIRVGIDHEQLLRNIGTLRALTRSSGSDSSLSFTLQRANLHEFFDIVVLADRLDMNLHVNHLLSPTSDSVYHLASEELADHLHRLDELAASSDVALDRNGRLWRTEVAGLRSHLARRLDHHAPASPSSASSAVDPDATAVIDVDLHVRVIAVPDSWQRARWGSLVGRHSTEIIDFLREEFGELNNTTLSFDDGVEIRLLTFGSHGDERRIEARGRSCDDGAQIWELRRL